MVIITNVSIKSNIGIGRLVIAIFSAAMVDDYDGAVGAMKMRSGYRFSFNQPL